MKGWGEVDGKWKPRELELELLSMGEADDEEELLPASVPRV